jgi:hypothetical protein
MKYKIFHPDGFFMCDIEIREDDSNFNKAQVNDPNQPNFNPRAPRWEPQENPPPEAVKTVSCRLPDGYNGDFVECEVEPIEIDGDNYKLRVKNSHLVRWCTRQQWENAVTNR